MTGPNADTLSLALQISPAVDPRAAEGQLALAAIRAIRARGLDPNHYRLPSINQGLCARAMTGELVTMEVRRA